MSVKEKVLHHLTRSDFARRAYGTLLRVPVLGTGFQKIIHTALPRGKSMWIRIPEGLANDFWIYADPRLELGYTNGDHEPWLQELLKSHLRLGDCFFDVGAHTGFFILVASRFVGSSGNIIAFEPDPENAATLRKNLSKNGLTQVVLIEAAAWSSTGQTIFEREVGISNRTRGHIPHESNSDSVINVPAICIDDVVFERGYPRPNFIKLDVEGAEWQALHGACRVLSEVKPKLLCEVHDGSQMSEIQNYLRQFDYVVEEWSPSHPHYPDYHQLYIWAVPRS